MLAASQVKPTYAVEEAVTRPVYWRAFSLDSGLIASPNVLLQGQDATPVPEGTAVLATATRLQIGPAELSFNSAACTLPSAYYRAEHSVYEGGMYQGCGQTAAAVEHDRITFSHLPPGSHISQCESPHASRFPQA